jgi:hypothetical protein
MKKTTTLLAGAILPLVAGMGIATSSYAQSATPIRISRRFTKYSLALCRG